jgi:type II secretion system protein J
MNPTSFSAHHGRQAGFTLLELLVATAVGAIVLFVINATFFSALRLHNTTHDRIDSDLSLQRTLGIIRKDLAGIMLPGGTLSGQLQSTVFSSSSQDPAGERITPDLFTDSGQIDGWTPYADVQKVAYFLAPASDGGSSKSLVRVITRNLLPAQDETNEEQTLLAGVASAQVAYYDGTDWTDTWDSTVTATLPTSIKFSLVLVAADPNTASSAPIELIVPVVVSTPASQQQTTVAANNP